MTNSPHLNAGQQANYTCIMSTDLETEILDRLLEPVTKCLTPAVAAQIAQLRADDATQQRVDELAEKAQEGTLSQDERAEYEAYISAGEFIAVLQAMARRRTAGDTAA